MLLGITGLAMSGKDTAADLIEQILLGEYSYTGLVKKRPLAGGLKEAVAALFNLSLGEIDSMKHESEAFVVYRSGSGDEGWQSLTMREILQRMGTEVGRDLFGQDFWCQIALPQGTGKNPEDGYYANPHKFIMVTDVRHENEVRYIKSLGGEILKVIRDDQPALTSGAAHTSELGIPTGMCDYLVFNPGAVSGGREAFKSALRDMLVQLFPELHQTPKEGEYA